MKRKVLMSQDGQRIVNLKQIKYFSVVKAGDRWIVYAEDINMGEYISKEDAEIELEQIGRYLEGWMDEDTGLLDVNKDISRMGKI